MKITASIQTPTPDEQLSLSFYLRLGFTKLEHPEPLFSDGSVTVELVGDRFARTGLKLYGEHWNEIVPRLPPHTPVIEREEMFVVGAPSGARVYLHKGQAKWKAQPLPRSRLGDFSGLSVETIDMSQSVQFWNALGFEISSGGVDKGWLTLSQEGAIDVSLMKMFSCPHLFPNPGLTYFNHGENPKLIRALRDARVPIAEEITHFNAEGLVDNVIVADPGGTGFFVFND